jgi:hypothetical protein
MLRRVSLTFLVLGCLVPAVHAHPIPFSYLDLRLNAGQIDSVLVAHIVDLAHDLNVEPPETLLDAKVAESKKDAIAELIRARLTLLADGRSVELELVRVEPLPDRQALSCELRLNANIKPSALRI